MFPLSSCSESNERTFPESEPRDSTFLTMSMPETTSPKTTCLPSSHEVTMVVMKNWDPLVLGPALAEERSPALVCLSLKFSSANFSPSATERRSQFWRRPNL